MARIRFLSDQIYETLGPNKGPKFPIGFVLDEADVGEVLGAPSNADHAASFLQRWVNMGVAERVGQKTPVSDHSDVVVVGVATPPAATIPEVSAVDELDLTKLTRTELDALAAARGVDITTAANKDDVIAALQLAAEAA